MARTTTIKLLDKSRNSATVLWERRLGAAVGTVAKPWEALG